MSFNINNAAHKHHSLTTLQPERTSRINHVFQGTKRDRLLQPRADRQSLDQHEHPRPSWCGCASCFFSPKIAFHGALRLTSVHSVFFRTGLLSSDWDSPLLWCQMKGICDGMPPGVHSILDARLVMSNVPTLPIPRFLVAMRTTAVLRFLPSNNRTR